jgi:hypothetical protein
MQSMSHLELKYHLNDIERSFVACRTLSQAEASGPFARYGWVNTLAKWFSSRPWALIRRAG